MYRTHLATAMTTALDDLASALQWSPAAPSDDLTALLPPHGGPDWPSAWVRACGPLPLGLSAAALVATTAQLAALRQLTAAVLDPAALLRDLWRGQALATRDPRWLAYAARLEATAQGVRNSLAGLRELPLGLPETSATEVVWRLVTSTQLRVTAATAGTGEGAEALADATVAVTALVSGLRAAAPSAPPMTTCAALAAAAAAASQQASWAAGPAGLAARIWAFDTAISAATAGLAWCTGGGAGGGDQ